MTQLLLVQSLEAQILLLAKQRELDVASHYAAPRYVGMSVAETLYYAIFRGQFSAAENIRATFKVSDHR